MFKIRKPTAKLRNQGIRIYHHGPKSRSNLNFSAKAAASFNSLPEELGEKDLNDRNFKNGLKKHIKINNRLAQH